MLQKDFEKIYQELKSYLIVAGENIKNLRKGPSFNITTKPDTTLVTNADYWANEYLCSKLESMFPNDVVIGEENEDKSYPADAECVWFIDPIDGTKQYVTGSGRYFILIGLAIKGEPALGISYTPLSGEFICGGTGIVPFLEKDGSRTNLHPPEWPEKGQKLITRHLGSAFENELKEEFGVTKQGYIPEYIQLLAPLFERSHGLIRKRKTYFWDLCAPAAIMKAAGYDFVMLDHQGFDVEFSGGNIFSSGYFSLPKSAPEQLRTKIRAFMTAEVQS